jgi:secreted trypsin-like serine protease
MHGLALAIIFCLWFRTIATALVGGATEVRDTGLGRQIVMIISTRGNFCTGTALARDLVLTAAHCVQPAATYRILIDKPPGIAIRNIVVHPLYKAQDYARGRVTADIALIKLDESLPNRIIPAALGTQHTVVPGDRLIVAGYGITKEGSPVGGGVARVATLVATGRPGNLQIRLVDPTMRGERLGLGACTGDSGAPAFVEVDTLYSVIGVVSWSTGPGGTAGCGGMTGLTPLTLYRRWIVETAKGMGSTI